jgi:hypothetical protein
VILSLAGLYIRSKLFGELCVSPVATQLLPLALGIEEDNTRKGECAGNLRKSNLPRTDRNNHGGFHSLPHQTELKLSYKIIY